MLLLLLLLRRRRRRIIFSLFIITILSLSVYLTHTHTQDGTIRAWGQNLLNPPSTVMLPLDPGFVQGGRRKLRAK